MEKSPNLICLIEEKDLEPSIKPDITPFVIPIKFDEEK